MTNDIQEADSEISANKLSMKETDNKNGIFQDIINSKILKWKEKLIDLSKHNRLLNFKGAKNASVKIIDEIPAEIFNILVIKSKQMKFLHINVNDDNTPEEQKLSKEELNQGIEFKSSEFKKYEKKLLAKKHTDNYLQTNLSENDLLRTLRKINTTAKTNMDDLGYNTLFLTLGSVIWYESDNSDLKYESPLILLPIRLVRVNMNDSFKIEYNDDDIIMNPALVLHLKKHFHIDLQDLTTQEIDDANILRIFETVQERISIKKRWKLLNSLYIGLFSFAKFVMYKDLEEHSGYIKKSSLVKSICGYGKEQEKEIEEACPIKELDYTFLPKDNFSILDADSSQQQAIAFVKKNNNLVIQGPPGTGKSQTIANIIAELLSQGKRVLFVSQKIAALNVVRSRLEKNGLAPYCLEMHSNKTNKREILRNLADSLSEPAVSKHTGTSLNILQEKRIELNEYAKAVHECIGSLQKSVFEAIGIVCNNSDIIDLEYIFDNFDKWDESALNYKKSIFTNLKNIIKILGNPKQYSWYGSHLKNLDSDYQNKIAIKSKLKTIANLLNELKISSEKLCKIIYIKEPAVFKDIENIINVAEIILDIPQGFFKKAVLDDENLIKNINKICECIKQFNLYNNKLKDNYSLGMLNEDLDFQIELFDNFSKKIISRISFEYLKRKKYIKKFFINGYKASAMQIYYDLKDLKELKFWLNEINNSNDKAESIFNELWNKEQSIETSISQSSKSIIKLKELLNQNVFIEDVVKNFKEQGLNYVLIKDLLEKTKYSLGNIKTVFDELTDIIKFNVIEAFENDFKNINIETFFNKINSMYDNIDDLTIWNRYLDTLDNIEKENLQGFYKKFINSNLDFMSIDRAFEVQFYRVWLNCFAYVKSNILREFNTAQHNNLIKQFKDLDIALINSAKLRLCEILHTNMVNGKKNFVKELANLKHESKLQRFRKSLRQIINTIPNLLLSAKPCLMMSPLTVSQLLDPSLFVFDYIIFDEASQLTTEDCIGSMIRGKRLIVAGDEQQLPPTSFFKSASETPEEDFSENEKEDLESILVECSISNFPKCMLKWHYRSKDEHLIAFSNKHLYRDLYTFPSSVETSDITGIKWHYYENTEHDAKKALQTEARMVAEAAIEHAKRFPARTLAVATLNKKQQELIEDEINELLKTEKDCMEFFDDKKSEPFFVKNLESIQGDERDVIFISIGIFKNQNGVLDTRSFGPITKSGGEKRLNVLITRARYKLEIFSAIRYGDFKDEKLKTEGVKLLKKYLEYAERGEVALFADTKTELDDKFDSPFEEAVCKKLRNSGLSVKTQVGCSGYRIDMAVRDENNPGEFLLGIECDGASYHSSATARDRDRLREEVLKNLGWKIYRIWSTDWFKNPQREFDKLLKYIEDLKISKTLNKDNNKTYLSIPIKR